MSTNKNTKPLFVVISGPSGSGKTTICRKIATHFNWYYSISHTTRKMRPGEENGKDYFFISQNEFDTMLKKNSFLEWAKVYDNYYGTSKEVIESKLNSGQSVVIDVDTQGALIIKDKMPQAILIFIKTPDLEELKKRLMDRKRDSLEDIEKRLQNTQKELEKTSHYNYVVVNNLLEKAINEIVEIINEEIKK